jgi:antitoxin component YwqK of YwqJK toxin-antitoxin module
MKTTRLVLCGSLLIASSPLSAQADEFQCREAVHCQIPYDGAGTINGVEVCFKDPARKEKRMETQWRNGLRHGPQKCFDQGGLVLSSQYINGIRQGEARQHRYDSAGDRVSFLSDGVVDGPRFRVRDSDVVSIDGCWSNGTFQSPEVLGCLKRASEPWRSRIVQWLETNEKIRIARLNGRREVKSESGQLIESYTLVNGSKEGEYKSWYESGKPKVTGAYKGDERVGEWITRSDEEQVVLREQYDRGQMVRAETRRLNGSLESVRSITWSEGRVQRTCLESHWENGKKRESECWLGSGTWWGVWDGDYQSWFESGLPSQRGKFQRGVRVGWWVTFSAEAANRVVREDEHRDGWIVRSKVRDGAFIIETEYHKDGSLKSTRRISADAI